MVRASLVAALLLACGPSGAPRLKVSSSAASVSAAEGENLSPPEPPRRGPEAAAREADDPDPGPDPVRRGGNLVVRTPPSSPNPDDWSRFRRDVEGGEAVGDERSWVGIDVPDFVELTDGSLELTVLDAGPDGYLAYYRDPLGASSCADGSPTACAGTAVLYAPGGKKLWRYALTGFLERTTDVEIRDVGYQGGMLYVAQACTSKPGEGCDRIVAIDTKTSTVAWRSPNGTASHRLAVAESLLASTSRGGVVTLDAKTGAVLDRRALDFEARDIELEGAQLVVFGEGRAQTRLSVGERGKLSPAN